MRYYLDTEFDGHNGALLSLALVREDGVSLHLTTTNRASDPWVKEHVQPLMERQDADFKVRDVQPDGVGAWLRRVIDEDQEPVIIADSPVDVGRFCQAISTGDGGGWASADYPRMTFEVHNVDCYPTTLPGALQHNAWWDAMALRHLLNPAKLGDGVGAISDECTPSTDDLNPLGGRSDSSAQSQPCADAGTHIPRSPEVQQALNECWRAVDALGGECNTAFDRDLGYIEAVTAATAEIEKLGGKWS